MIRGIESSTIESPTVTAVTGDSGPGRVMLSHCPWHRLRVVTRDGPIRRPPGRVSESVEPGPDGRAVARRRRPWVTPALAGFQFGSRAQAHWQAGRGGTLSTTLTIGASPTLAVCHCGQ